jgi:hypothetical protein
MVQQIPLTDSKTHEFKRDSSSSIPFSEAAGGPRFDAALLMMPSMDTKENG